MTSPTPETRRWRLRGYDKDKNLVHESTCNGDAALDTALSDLERDPSVVRHTVSPA